MLHRYLLSFRTMKFSTQTKFGVRFGPTDTQQQQQFPHKHCKMCNSIEVKSRRRCLRVLSCTTGTASVFVVRIPRLTRMSSAITSPYLSMQVVTETTIDQGDFAVSHIIVMCPRTLNHGQTVECQKLRSCSAADPTCINSIANIPSWTDSCSKSTIGGMEVVQTVLTVTHLRSVQAHQKSSIPAGTLTMRRQTRGSTSSILALS